jgi:hypothetical protein
VPNLDLDNHASLLHQILILDVIPEVWNTLADSPSPICQVGGGTVYARHGGQQQQSPECVGAGGTRGDFNRPTAWL